VPDCREKARVCAMRSDRRELDMSRARIQRTYLAIVGAAAAVAVAGGVFAAWAGTSTAAPTVAPQNVGEPTVSGATRVGQVLRTTRGTWTGTPPIT